MFVSTVPFIQDIKQGNDGNKHEHLLTTTTTTSRLLAHIAIDCYTNPQRPVPLFLSLTASNKRE